jgi:hypothetical protein
LAGLGVAAHQDSRRDIDSMQASNSIGVPDTFMTLPDACLFSEAFGQWPISTGKERDTESGNDYFNARYYGSSMGRGNTGT